MTTPYRCHSFSQANHFALCAIGMLLVLLPQAWCTAQDDFEEPPILYYQTPPQDPIASLQERIDTGDVQLDFSDDHGYLESVLAALGVRDDSQMLVFSKTSFQLRRISPSRPRAVYFNDDVYVGWVQNGDVLEVSAVDPQQGAMFYTLRQRPEVRPQFVRDRGDCLSCHASSRTAGVPGHLVRSVFVSPSGQPHFGAGTFTTLDSSPFKERWGGWYVTGTHGTVRHMGNLLTDDNSPEALDRDAGANIIDLSHMVDTSPYLSPHSDLVALLVLEHQSYMHNLITRANYDTRRAIRDAAVINRMLKRPEDELTDSTRRRIENTVERMLKYMLFVDAVSLDDPVNGTSGFADRFAAEGPSDQKGRSLRQLDLKNRVFKYPCSYLIYSTPFDALPKPAKDHFYQRLYDVLSGHDSSEDFAHLTSDDRTAVLEILRDTKPDLPKFWRPSDSETR